MKYEYEIIFCIKRSHEQRNLQEKMTRCDNFVHPTNSPSFTTFNVRVLLFKTSDTIQYDTAIQYDIYSIQMLQMMP